MIKLPDVQPEPNILDVLKSFQVEIDSQVDFQAQSALAKTNFSNKNKKGNQTFDEVLRLNHVEREFLRQARQEAFHDYSARLLKFNFGILASRKPN